MQIPTAAEVTTKAGSSRQRRQAIVLTNEYNERTMLQMLKKGFQDRLASKIQGELKEDGRRHRGIKEKKKKPAHA